MAVMSVQKKLVPIAILLALLLAGPVLATPKEKDLMGGTKAGRTAFTNRVIVAAGNSSPGEQSITDGILYVKGAVSTGWVEAGSDSPISGLIWTILSGSVDLDTMVGSFNGKWTMINEKGTLEGSVVGTVEVAAVSGKFVGFGTGYFEGQKIKGSFVGTVNNYVVDLVLQGILAS